MKTKQKIIYITLVLGIISIMVFESCDYYTPPEDFDCTLENTVYYPEDALSRFYFKDSTYWIYRDSISGIYDSVWIENSIKAISKYEDEYGHSYQKCYERFAYDLYSSKYDMSYLVTPSYGQEEINYSTERFGIDDHPNGVHSNGIYKVRLTGNTYNDGNGNGGVQVLVDTLIVSNHIYTNVLRIYYPSQTFDYLLDAYYAKHIGLIKCKRTDGTVWELIKHNIVQ